MTTLSNLPAHSPTLGERLAKRWWLIFLVFYGLWVWLPFLAPIFMHWGWERPAHLIYTIYSFFCHQLPERSYFFFGSQTTYSLKDIQAAWVNTYDILTLRKFIGTPEMGWKVAWSDRMISFYGGTWLSALLWVPVRDKKKPLRWWILVILILPIALDVGTHFVSDLSGIGQGFRYTNQWLVNLTHAAFSPNFYAGDALGSFNSWMRIISGLLAGFGLVGFAFPFIEEANQI